MSTCSELGLINLAFVSLACCIIVYRKVIQGKTIDLHDT